MRMKEQPIHAQEASGQSRRATNVSLPAELVREARALGVSVSQAAEAGLRAEIAQIRARRWREENKAAIEAWNTYVEEHGVPLAEFRQF
jgi:antitoxin CcdA